MAEKIQILVPKAGADDKFGTQVKLYQLDEIVDAKEDWQDSLMGAFVQNGWAMEVKADSAEETVEVEADIKEQETKMVHSKVTILVLLMLMKHGKVVKHLRKKLLKKKHC